MTSENEKSRFSRREFLKGSAVSLAALGGGTLLSGCQPKEAPVENAAEGQVAAAESGSSTADWLGTAPEISDADCIETVDTEVLVVGAGCAGMFAACAAAESGAQTMIIEKLAVANGIRSSAIGAVGSKMQQAVGADIDKTEIVNDMSHFALNFNDMNLVKTWADHSAEMADWYIDFVNERGKCEIILEHAMPEGKTRYKMWPTGHGTKSLSEENAETLVTNDMIEYVLGLDGEYRTETSLAKIIMEDGAAVGIYATNSDGEYIRINASKGVIIATGGYARNEEMYTALQGETKKSLAGLIAFPGATGDGLKAAIWAGAKFDRFHSCMIFDRGVVAPDVDLGDPFNNIPAYYHIATQPFLKVNKNGKRITNESSPYDFIVHAAANFEDKAWYQIYDSDWREDVLRFHTIGCSTIPVWEGGNHHPEGLDGCEAAINGYIEEGKVFKADTIEELAGYLGLDADNLVETVDRYNELYEMGEDVDFGKDFFRMSTLNNPPFYGAKIGGLMLCTMDGVQIDTNGQAISVDDELIPGLFVVGNDSGKYYLQTYPNFGAGTNAGRSATFGRICGKYVASL